MTRILFFLLPFFLLSACAPRGTGNASDCAKIGDDDADVQSLQLICRVLEFSFCDARPDVKRSIMIGPFRLLGVAEEYIYSQLLPPFGSSLNTLTPYYADGLMDVSVAMYSDKLGFFEEHQPCWRLRVVTPAVADIQNLILEVNYSYCYDDANGSGYVNAMQRLPLRAMEVSVHGVGSTLRETSFYRYSNDDTLPFSIVCLSFMLPEKKFYPL